MFKMNENDIMFKMTENDVLTAKQYISSVIVNPDAMVPSPTVIILMLAKKYNELDDLLQQIFIYGVYLFLQGDKDKSFEILYWVYNHNIDEVFE